MDFGILADLIRDYWYIFVAFGVVLFAGVIGYFIYIEWNIFVMPLIHDTFSNLTIDFSSFGSSQNLTEVCKEVCTCPI
jgi:hypothetical protein